MTETDEPMGESEGMSNPTTRRKKPVKPALKSSSSRSSGNNGTTDHDYDHHTTTDDDSETDSRKTSSTGKFAKKRTKKANRTLKWDEAMIQEHDQLRGTRMKIEEANTPFAYYDSGSETDGSFGSARGMSVASNDSGGSHRERGKGGPPNRAGGICWDALTNKLEAHAAVAASSSSAAAARFAPGSGGESEGDGDGHLRRRDEQRAELKRLEFQEHRKRHYNEMEVLRRFRREHPDGEPTANGHGEDEGEDEDD